jgi:hypothetical protein
MQPVHVMQIFHIASRYTSVTMVAVYFKGTLGLESLLLFCESSILLDGCHCTAFVPL